MYTQKQLKTVKKEKKGKGPKPVWGKYTPYQHLYEGLYKIYKNIAPNPSR